MRRGLLIAALVGPVLGCITGTPPAVFETGFADGVERVWIGPDFYANRLQDWRLRGGRVEAVEGGVAKPMRTAHLLTWTVGSDPGTLAVSVRTGPLVPGASIADAWGGLLLGVGGDHVDFRISALSHHWPSEDGGMIVAVDASGRIVVRDNSVFQGYRGPDREIPLEAWPEIEADSSALETDHGSLDMNLQLQADRESGRDTYWLDVRLVDVPTDRVIARASYSGIPGRQLDGNLALASHRSGAGEGPGYWFDDLRLGGSKIEPHPERAFGPIMGAFHTVSRATLKMTAQLAPPAIGDGARARLELDSGDGWRVAATAAVDPLSATTTFRIEGWDDSVAVRYRVAYDLVTGPASTETHTYQGTVRAAPTGNEFVLAAMNCQHISGGQGQWNHQHFWYPHAETVTHVAGHQPDMVFFAGDQR